MKYTTAFNIYTATDLSKIQPGQWVWAGDEDEKGMFLGVKPSGTVVVAWNNNIKVWKHKRKEYIKSLRKFALSC